MHFIMYGCVYNLLSTTCMGTLGPDKDNAVSPEPSETGDLGTRGPGKGDQGTRGLAGQGSGVRGQGGCWNQVAKGASLWRSKNWLNDGIFQIVMSR